MGAVWARLLGRSSAPESIARAFIVIDMQYDFLEGGSLAVTGANQCVPVINKLREKFNGELVVFSQDWHPKGHVSYASSHPGAKPFTVLKLQDGTDQEMWPDHCTQGSHGAEFHADLIRAPSDVVVQKGFQHDVDSYSAFADNTGNHPTELHNVLQKHKVKEVYVCGVATDYCVNFTCQDAVKRGYKTFLVEDAVAGVAPDSTQKALDHLSQIGVTKIKSTEIPSIAERRANGVV